MGRVLKSGRCGFNECRTLLAAALWQRQTMRREYAAVSGMDGPGSVLFFSGPDREPPRAAAPTTFHGDPSKMPKLNRTVFQLTMGALLLAGTIGAQAANLGFLNDTPLSYMKQRDIDSLKNAAFQALDNKQDGDSVNWTNEGTGNSVKLDAQITPEGTAKDGQNTCRFVRVSLNAKGQSMALKPKFCRQGSGRWILQKKH
jgi:surface antigen